MAEACKAKSGSFVGKGKQCDRHWNRAASW